MKFSLHRSKEILERTPGVLEAMLPGLSAEWLNSNEGEGTWNVSEVVAHLIVCERTNWLPRVKVILSDQADKRFSIIDMNGHFDMAKKATLEALLREFKLLRKNSVLELTRFHLQVTDFAKTAIHPKLKEVSLQQLIATWVAHDLSHLCQIMRIMARQYRNEVGPFQEFLKILR